MHTIGMSTDDIIRTFSTSPEPFTTHTGATDTLLFALDDAGDVVYTLSCSPILTPKELHFADSTGDGVSRVHFDPDQPGDYMVTLFAEVGTHSAEATVAVSVLPSFTPFSVPHSVFETTAKFMPG